MYLLQAGPANTTSYMLAGYFIIFGVMFLYLLSITIRRRNLSQDWEVMQEMKLEEETNSIED